MQQAADSVLSVSLKEFAMDPLEPRFEMSFVKNHHQAIRRRALGNEIQPQIGNSSQGQSGNARLLDQSLPHQANGCFPPLNFHRAETTQFRKKPLKRKVGVQRQSRSASMRWRSNRA